MNATTRPPALARSLVALAGVFGSGAALAQAGEEVAVKGLAAAPAASSWTAAAPYFAAAVVMSMACVAAAYAVGKVGAAALGAAAEKPELLVKSIVLVGLGEGIAVFGLIISMLLIAKAG